VESREFDLIVIGAGPAGSFAAEKIAAAGRRVALFDGRPKGEPKACGGGVTSKALNEWPHLKDAVGRLIDRIEMYSPGGKRLDLKLEQPFAIYSRVAFDTYLRNRAANSGAIVYEQKVSFAKTRRTANGWAVSGDNGLQISAPILVAADGANSRFAKEWAGAVPVSEMEVAFGYRAPLPSDSEPATVVAFLP
jgi:flavin-dependent dehydrogenase